MSVYIGLLTLYTGMSPVTNIGVDTLPNKSGSNDFLSYADSLVRQTVE